MEQKKKSINYIFNFISIVGFLIAGVAASLVIVIISYEYISGVENPYLGMVTYFGLPGLVVLGLALVPIGALWFRWRRRGKTEEEVPPFPRIDLNDPQKRFHFFFIIIASFGFVIIISVASLKGFEFTESTTFCGELCHTVMSPEHTAWSNSPHAKVKCVECHVGPGAAWYVKAKISGLRQVYAVLTHSFPSPIETPIENLRPARDTCEHCHWPEKFYSGRQKIFYHYAPNEENTPREVNLLIKIGGTPKSPHAMGIHWHIGTEVNYVARDQKRLDIPYIAVKEKDGSITEYFDSEKPLTKDEIAKAKKRLMDCTDCHNRPTHIYRSPGQEMDENLVSGHIDIKLPFVKKVGVELLEKPYKTKKEGLAAIAAELPAYYAKNYPAVAREKSEAIKEAVDGLIDMGIDVLQALQFDARGYHDDDKHLVLPASFPPRRANRGFYSNPNVDALLNGARQQVDQDARRANYLEVQRILNDDLPYIHLWYLDNVLVHTRRVRNLQLNPSGNYDFLLRAELAR